MAKRSKKASRNMEVTGHGRGLLKKKGSRKKTREATRA